jgi:hypothetical protein
MHLPASKSRVHLEKENPEKEFKKGFAQNLSLMLDILILIQSE